MGGYGRTLWDISAPSEAEESHRMALALGHDGSLMLATLFDQIHPCRHFGRCGQSLVFRSNFLPCNLLLEATDGQACIIYR